MSDPIVATFAGQTLTVGILVSFLSQYLKGKDVFGFLPEGFRRYGLRLFIIGICIVLNAGAAILQGQPVDMQALVEAAMSYAVASATYDNLFRS